MPPSASFPSVLTSTCVIGFRRGVDGGDSSPRSWIERRNRKMMGEKEKLIWDQMKPASGATVVAVAGAPGRAIHKFFFMFVIFISALYVIYTLNLISSPRSCDTDTGSNPASTIRILTTNMSTEIGDVVFGIAASSKLWEKRKNYIKLWYKPEVMRGVVWLDGRVNRMGTEKGLPPVRISGNTSEFAYRNRKGHRSAIRISRIVSETLRLGMKGVKWFVMGDDDTVFFTDNLLRVLSKYDHEQLYYIGSSSESHLQNIYFSYGMAYGGGGFAISYPLAVALENMQDRCIHRYPGLYGSDDRIQACMAEIGVPLTKESGFHQYDVYGSLFGLLAAHPLAPVVSLHHLDVVEPIFPNLTRLEALNRLAVPTRLDSAGLMQQSICYDKGRGWTVSVSWGYAVQIFRGVISPREVEMPARTFLNWYKRADYTAYSFNTRPVSRNPCQKPFVFYFSTARSVSPVNRTVSEYSRHKVPRPVCNWKMADPDGVRMVVVYKKPDPHLWQRAPRRNCCRVLETRKEKMVVDVGVCREGEISEA